jgi:hypothetical protein
VYYSVPKVGLSTSVRTLRTLYVPSTSLRERVHMCAVIYSVLAPLHAARNTPQPDEQLSHCEVFFNFIDEWKVARGNEIWNLSSLLLHTIFGMLIDQLERNKIIKEVIKITMFQKRYDPV